MLDLSSSVGDCSHLRVYSRGEKFILFNPSVPSWVYCSPTGAVLLKIASQGYPVAQVIEIAAANGIEVESSRHFFETCEAANLFEIAEKSNRWVDGARTGRRLASIYLHLTNKCNLSCSYCYRNSSPRISIKRFGEEFIEFLEASRPICEPGVKLTFSGGEPMMHPDFWTVAAHAQKIGYSNHLLTNGTYITPANASALASLFRYVKISVDGATEEMHSRTRGDGNFETVVNAIHLLSQYTGSVELEVQMTVSQDNLDEVNKLKGILPDKARIKYTPLMAMGRGLQGDSEGRISSDTFHSVSQRLDDAPEREMSRSRSGQRSLGCYAGDAHISVADNGDVYPCHLFHQTEFKMGNIFVDSVSEIFHSKHMTDFAASMDVENNNSRCSSCDFRYLCGGGCKANPLHAHKDYRRSDTYCGFIRNTLLDDLFIGWREPGRAS